MPKRHVIQEGECVASLAAAHGLFPATVWDHPDNAALKELRRDPYVLYPGDVLVIPDLRQKTEAVETGYRHSFRRRGVPEKLNVQLLDEDDAPYANRRYTIDVDGRQSDGVTDGAGIVDRWIPPGAKRAIVTFEPLDGEDEPIVWDLSLGAINPADTGEGIGDRLHNLGFAPEGDESAEDVVRSFQRARGLTPTGEVDDALAQALAAEHGC